MFISCAVHRDLSFNIITSIKSGDFIGLGSLTILSVQAMHDVIAASSLRIIHRFLHSNLVTSIESGAFTGFDNLRTLSVITIWS